jgi:hypothetical protein
MDGQYTFDNTVRYPVKERILRVNHCEVAAQHGHVADAAARRQDRCDFDGENQPDSYTDLEGGAANAQTVGPLLRTPVPITYLTRLIPWSAVIRDHQSLDGYDSYDQSDTEYCSRGHPRDMGYWGQEVGLLLPGWATNWLSELDTFRQYRYGVPHQGRQEARLLPHMA